MCAEEQGSVIVTDELPCGCRNSYSSLILRIVAVVVFEGGVECILVEVGALEIPCFVLRIPAAAKGFSVVDEAAVEREGSADGGGGRRKHD